jgi:NADH dehydrogenase FAD-containing subunit
VTIVTPKLLPGNPESLAAQARSEMKKLGIVILEGAKVAPDALASLGSHTPVFPEGGITAPLITTSSTASDIPKTVKADAIFAATGLTPNNSPLLAAGQGSWPLTDSGFVRVTETLAVDGVAKTYAIGDIAELPNPIGKLAFMAGLQGNQAAANLVADVVAECSASGSAKPGKKFSPPPATMSVAALGPYVSSNCVMLS